MRGIDLDKETQSIAQAQVELDQRKEAVAAEQRRRLQVEHKALVQQCREAKNLFQKLADGTTELQRRAFQARGECVSAERNLANCRVSAPNPSSYPTEEETETWQGELKQCESAVALANEAEAAVVREMLAARSERNAADENFQRLADKELDLRSRLDPPRSRPFATSTITSPGVTIETRT